MSYTVVLEDEHATRVDSEAVGSRAIDHLLGHISEDKYPWLATLDPYGDTTFNRLQAPHIMAELEQLKRSATTPEEESVIDQILRLAKRCRAEGPNAYLRFYGD